MVDIKMKMSFITEKYFIKIDFFISKLDYILCANSTLAKKFHVSGREHNFRQMWLWSWYRE